MKFHLVAMATVLFIISCTSNVKESSAQSDSSAMVSTPDTALFIPHEGYAKQFEQYKSSNLGRLDMLATYFTPEEVYIELLTRTGEIRKDTLPPIVRDNYSIRELERIQSKNQQLKGFNSADILYLYEQVMGGRDLIRGRDDRLPVFYDDRWPPDPARSTPSMEDGRCVLAIISKDSLKPDGQGYFRFTNRQTFGDRYSLCDWERFMKEPSYAEGTGFLADSTIMVTAEHCINDNNKDRFYFVFDYLLDRNESFTLRIPASKVYEARTVKCKKDKISNIDYAVVTLNRKAERWRIAKINFSGKINTKAKFHVIGASGGLPLKIANNSEFLSDQSAHCFSISSDTYHGNSGSPVFNSETHEVEGMLIGGDEDFDFYTRLSGLPCKSSIRCPQTTCRKAPNGEIVARVSQFSSLLKSN